MLLKLNSFDGIPFENFKLLEHRYLLLQKDSKSITRSWLPTYGINRGHDWKHYSAGEEGVALVRGVGEKGQPGPGALGPAVEPEGVAEVGFGEGRHAPVAVPKTLTATGQHYGSHLGVLKLIKKVIIYFNPINICP